MRSALHGTVLTRAALGLSGLLGLGACNAVLGLDAPTLDRCEGGCADAGVQDAGGNEAAAEAGTDSGPACVTQTGVGVRCGGGAGPAQWCNGCAPLCCQGGTSAAPTFTCVADTSKCEGYAIECATYNDCNNSDICCRFMQHQVCDTASRCPTSEVVCDSTTKDACPTGTTCKVPLVGDAAATSPYLGCAP